MAVLVIIDVQLGFINDETGHIPERVERLQREFETVFATRFENPEGSPFRKLKGLVRFAPGMPGVPGHLTPCSAFMVGKATRARCASILPVCRC